jgi:endonuclease YncB( thermonuclease family)
MKQLFMLFLLLTSTFAIACVQKDKPIFVQTVIDGDTFVTQQGQVIRLANVDAPEITQLYGQESKAFLQRQILHRTVYLQYSKTDVYKREVCNVYLPNKLWINKLMIDSGYAWAYSKYSVLHELQIKVRSERVGLWKYKAVPPFVYRRQMNVAIQTKPLPMTQ